MALNEEVQLLEGATKVRAEKVKKSRKSFDWTNFNIYSVSIILLSKVMKNAFAKFLKG